MRGPSVLVIGVAGVGLVLVWSAVHGANVTSSLKDLLGGRSAGAPASDPALVTYSGPEAAVATGAGGAELGVAPGGGSSPAANRANGQLQAAGRGWTGDQWTALEKLWTQESGWNNLAQNPTSTAYGIAQFLDSTWSGYGSKTSDPTLQIRYGLAYIAHRYGTPAAAWAHEVAQGWY